jgi:hypothetical protein
MWKRYEKRSTPFTNSPVKISIIEFEARLPGAVARAQCYLIRSPAYSIKWLPW